jgi:hypothetical protein
MLTLAEILGYSSVALPRSSFIPPDCRRGASAVCVARTRKGLSDARPPVELRPSCLSCV